MLEIIPNKKDIGAEIILNLKDISNEDISTIKKALNKYGTVSYTHLTLPTTPYV